MTGGPPPALGLDLLRERRLELGLPDPLVELRESRHLLRQGLVSAGGLVALVALLGLAASFRYQLVLVELDRVAVVEAKVAELQVTLDQARRSVAALQQQTRLLANALVGTRSGSALLRQLQLLVPQGIQLRDVKTAGRDALTIVGVARDPQSFARINALELQLEASPLLVAPQVRLNKATRQAADANAGDPQLADKVLFEISATLSPPLPAVQEAAVLRQLGADGMVRRLQLLERERLLP